MNGEYGITLTTACLLEMIKRGNASVLFLECRRDMSPLPPRRAHDIGFSDAVSDVVDIVKHETSRRGRARGIFRTISIILTSASKIFASHLKPSCVATNTAFLGAEHQRVRRGIYVLE